MKPDRYVHCGKSSDSPALDFMASALFWMTIILFILWIVGCSAAPATPQVVEKKVEVKNQPTLVAKPSSAESVLGLVSEVSPNAINSLVAAAFEAEKFRGVCRVIHGPTACQPISGYNPGLRTPDLEPVVGRSINVDWTSDACTQPQPTPRVMSLLVSLRSPPAPLAVGSGCWLLVHPDYLLVPQPGSMLAQDGGWLRLRWVPTPEWAGRTVWAQLIVLVPGDTESNHRVSPAIEIAVGSG